jgi:NitT/TauT family transport system permease protein
LVCSVLFQVAVSLLCHTAHVDNSGYRPSGTYGRHARPTDCENLRLTHFVPKHRLLRAFLRPKQGDDSRDRFDTSVERDRRAIMAYETHEANHTWMPGKRTPTIWRRRLTRHRNLMLAPVVLVTGILLWAGLVAWQQLPAFILPGPAVVAQKFVVVAADGSLSRHIGVTVLEIALGLLLGLSTAFVLGYLLGKSRPLEQIVSPYIVASQSIPIVAIAPLLVIWLGSGLLSKVIVCALISFFPALISTIVGIRSVDPDLHDLMRSLRATRSQMFWKLELPSAMPMLFGGLKLSVTLAVVGAVVAEFVGADAGLGFVINLARGVLDTPLMFVAVFTLVLIAQSLNMVVALLENHFLRWQRQS